ncbi:MAG: hypothetical protein P8J27_03030 [Mariniblastus sp.]|nr:hypothetical protein [Mariniblastus sp.]
MNRLAKNAIGIFGFGVAAVGLAISSFAQHGTPLPISSVPDAGLTRPLPLLQSTSPQQPRQADSSRSKPVQLPGVGPQPPLTTKRTPRPIAQAKMPARSQTSPEASHVVEDINGIRRLLGGGVAESLNGLIANDQALRDAARKDFEDELLRLQTEQAALGNQGFLRQNREVSNPLQSNPVAGAAPGPSASHGRLHSPQRSPSLPLNPANAVHFSDFGNPEVRPKAGINRGESPRFADQPRLIHRVNGLNQDAPARRFSGPQPSPTRRLRESAVKLEQIAAQLEESELYEQADEIRVQAQNLWLKAREMGVPPKGGR